jgi:hypothetical protein
MNESDIQNVIEEIELEKSNEKISAVRVFRSLLNQPDFVAINSNDKTETEASTGFSEFSINLPRPILEAESIQLVSATIPTCTQNIPDTACVFWYYKLSAYSGFLPCVNNLHFVRLLPSYYKQEQIHQYENYGFNKTFNDYEELGNELQKACVNDLGDTIYQGRDPSLILNYESIYIPNDISITYNPSINKFQMLGKNTYTVPEVSVFLSNNLYQIGSIVRYDGRYYQAFISNAQIAIPGTNPAIWKEFTFSQIWLSTTTYAPGDTVIFQDKAFFARVSNTNIEPTDADTWEIWYDEFVWNRYLITGYSDPNVAKVQKSLKKPWEAEFVFEVGDIVEFKNESYVALRQSKNILPTEPYAWSDITPTEAPFIGLKDLSEVFDFKYYGIDNIPSQPFNDVPKRLLNSILGFCFNGRFSLTQFTGYTGNNAFQVQNNDILLLNRIRPIPLYIKNTISQLLGATLSPFYPTGSSLYTADGYCNLVFSNTVQLYGSVVQGATLNSSTSTGLLGSVMLDAKNLGVSFFQEGFSAPLSIFGSDIYSISFQLKDDFNEPYFLTNNAVIILVLKITYK